MGFIGGKSKRNESDEEEEEGSIPPSIASSVFVPTRLPAINEHKSVMESRLSKSRSKDVLIRKPRVLGEESDRVDFIRKLPVHLGKRIVNLCSLKWILNCAKVSEHWRSLSLEVMADRKQTKLNQDSYLRLLSQGAGCFDENAIRKGKQIVV